MSESLHYFLPYQHRWIDDNASVAIVEKSRRIGFTFAEAYRSVERRIKLKTNHYFASRDKESARLFLDDCKRFVRVFGAVAEDLGERVIDKERDLTAYVLRFKDGQTIMALSSNPDVFRGKGGDITLDEFAFHQDPRGVLKAANASAKVWGHQVRIVSTHNGQDNLFNKLVEAARKGERKMSLHRATLLDAVDQGLVEVIQRRPAPDAAARAAFVADIHDGCIDEDEWNEEYLCTPSSENTSLLTYDLIGGCEVSNLQLVNDPAELATTGSFFAGFDVARRKHLSVLWTLERVGDVYWTRMVRTMAAASFTAQEGVLHQLMRNRAVRRLCIDATGLGMQMAERMAERWGRRVEAVTFTANVKAELAVPMRRLFEDKIVRVPSDDETREDLHKVRKVTTAAGNVRYDAAQDEAGHADRFWALALAYHAADDNKRPLPPPQMRKPVGW